MLVKIKDDIIFKNKIPQEVEKSISLQKKIEENWNNFILEYKADFNGDIFVVTELKNIQDNYSFEIGKAKYADYIYAKENTDLTILTLFTATVLRTKDNYYVFIRNNNGVINAIGGLASIEDFKDNIFIPELCLERELKEELGLSLNNKKDVINWSAKYLKIPNKKEFTYPCGILFVTNLTYTKEELNLYFNKCKETLDIEVKELLFYTKDNYLELNNEEKKESYLVELIEMLEKDK